jgi:thiol-disulfide isomerase/thioredoxin
MVKYVVCGTALLAAVAVLQVREMMRQEEAAAPRPSLQLRSAAPELELPGFRGEVVRLSDFRGKLVLVKFWASWCMPCRLELVDLAELVEDWNRQPGRTHDLAWLAVAHKDEANAVLAIARDRRYRQAVFAEDADGRAGQVWLVGALPTLFLLDSEQRLVDVVKGYPEHLRPGLSLLLSRFVHDHGGAGKGSGR